MFSFQKICSGPSEWHRRDEFCHTAARWSGSRYRIKTIDMFLSVRIISPYPVLVNKNLRKIFPFFRGFARIPMSGRRMTGEDRIVKSQRAGKGIFEGEGAEIGKLHRASTGRCRGRDSRARRCTAEPNRAALKRKQSPELSLRGPNGAVAISGRQLRFRR